MSKHSLKPAHQCTPELVSTPQKLSPGGAKSAGNNRNSQLAPCYEQWSHGSSNVDGKHKGTGLMLQTAVRDFGAEPQDPQGRGSKQKNPASRKEKMSTLS